MMGDILEGNGAKAEIDGTCRAMSSNWTTTSVAREEKCFDVMIKANDRGVEIVHNKIDVFVSVSVKLTHSGIGGMMCT